MQFVPLLPGWGSIICMKSCCTTHKADIISISFWIGRTAVTIDAKFVRDVFVFHRCIFAHAYALEASTHAAQMNSLLQSSIISN